MSAGPRPEAPGGGPLRSRLRDFFLRRWAGRLLLVAVPLLIFEALGVRAFDGFHRLLLLTLAVAFGCWFVLRLFAGRLFYKIRTKLIVSYLFIALVPIFLLTIFFVLQAVIVLYAVGTHVVSAELETAGAKLQSFADTALVVERTRGLSKAELEDAIAPSRAVHPDIAYAAVSGRRVVASSGTAPTELPAWWTEKRRVSLVSEEVEGVTRLVLRAAAREGDAFVVIDAPVDATLFAALPARGLTFQQVAGRMPRDGDSRDDHDIAVQVDDDDREGGDTRPRLTYRAQGALGGIPLGVLPDGTEWQTGRTAYQAIVFWMDPRALMSYLSTKSFRTPDIVRYVLIAVGVFFLAMYGVALLLGLLLARSITRSVHALSQGTERLRAGRLHDADPGHEPRPARRARGVLQPDGARASRTCCASRRRRSASRRSCASRARSR